MTSTKLVQFTKKQIEVANKIAEGYSHRDIEREEIASKRYVDELRANPEFNRYLYSLLEEWRKTSRDELLLIAKQKIRKLLGHSDISTTQIYITLANIDVENAMNNFREII